jgi:hypothetical protein
MTDKIKSVTASGLATLLNQTKAECFELPPCRRERRGKQVERRPGRQGQIAALGMPDQPQAVPGAHGHDLGTIGSRRGRGDPSGPPRP